MLQFKVRWIMVILFLSSLYSHYYGWWTFFNYINDGFYAQWYHQWFFSLTELISTICIIHLCNIDNRIDARTLLVIMSINITHIVVSSLDQFISHVFLRTGKLYEVVRDFGLMLPDILHVLVVFFELSFQAERQNISLFNLFYKKETIVAILFIFLLALLATSL